MTISEAHKISLMGYVSSLGYKPIQTHNGRYVCNSPFRPEERTPSFYLYDDKKRGKWTYKDFGSNGKGGDIIDFIMTLHNVSELGALMLLDSPELSTTKYFSFIGDSSKETNEPKIEIKHVQPLQNKALLQYLTSRKINPTLAGKYCQEAYYLCNGKENFSVAFENDLHAFELRNKYFKCASSPKTITTIAGKNPLIVNLFEGFMDLLSALTYYKTSSTTNTCIILNSNSLIDRFLPLMPKYTKINLFLDNDPSGIETTNKIQALRPDAVNRSKSIFPKSKDFNDFLINQ